MEDPVVAFEVEYSRIRKQFTRQTLFANPMQINTSMIISKVSENSLVEF